MTLFDLLFLLSALSVLVALGALAVSAVRGRWKTVQRIGSGLGVFVGCYGVALIALALASPRRIYSPGERRCYDEWCVAMAGIRRGGNGVWLADVEVSSEARRVRQRAPDARAELEDEAGRRYSPIATPGARLLSDAMGPGESFHALLSFRLPEGAKPAGLILHHGDFPGAIILGDDSSFLHARSLMRF